MLSDLLLLLRTEWSVALLPFSQEPMGVTTATTPGDRSPRKAKAKFFVFVKTLFRTLFSGSFT